MPTPSDTLARRLAPVPTALALLTGATLAQESAAPFDSPVVVFDGTHRFERTLDLNGDGYQDAFGWYVVDSYYSSIRLRGYLNDGHGKLEESWSFSTGGDFDLFDFSGSAVADWNGDGRDDFALAVQGEVRAYLSGNGTQPAELLTDSSLKRTYGLDAGDFNDDGQPDFAVLRESLPFQPREIVVWTNAGGATFSQTAVIPVVGQATDLIATDTNGDGSTDLAYNSDGYLRILPQVGGVFGAEVAIPHFVSSNPMLTHGDIDGDGDGDFVVFSSTTYSVIRNNGGSYAAEPFAVGGPATGFADIDGDGDLDGVCCGGGGPTSIFNRTDSKFEIAINDGTGAFAPSFQIQGLGSHHLAGAVDLENDGDLDLVAGRCIYYSRGAIAEPPTPTVDLQGVSVPVSTRSLGDAEGDGDVDFVVGAGPQSLNLGDGSNVPSAPLVVDTPVGHSYQGPGFRGDFDGDGYEDLIVSGYINTAFQRMRLLRGNGGGGYADVGAAGPAGLNFNQGPCLLCEPSYPDDPSLGFVHDYDGDGDLDLATVTPLDYTPGITRFFRNDGTGFLESWTDYNGQCLKGVADFNQDGLADLLSTGPFNNLGVSLGRVDPAWPFDPFNAMLAGNEVFFLDDPAIADLDGDGDLDVASFQKNGPYDTNAYWFWNDGAGGFTAELVEDVLLAQSYSSYEIPSRVFADDVNGDGLTDLIWTDVLYNIWPEFARTVAVQLRSADNSGYEAPIHQVGNPRALADVDGDGDGDLIGDRIIYSTLWGEGAGSRLQYGAGSPGTGGMVPTLGATGPFRIGESPAIHLTGAVGGGPSFLIFSDTPTALPGWPAADNTLLVDILAGLSFTIGPFVSGAPGGPGQGGFELPVAVGPALVGQPWFHQAITFDLTDPEILVTSNGLELTYGL